MINHCPSLPSACELGETSTALQSGLRHRKTFLGRPAGSPCLHRGGCRRGATESERARRRVDGPASGCRLSACGSATAPGVPAQRLRLPSGVVRRHPELPQRVLDARLVVRGARPRSSLAWGPRLGLALRAAKPAGQLPRHLPCSSLLRHGAQGRANLNRLGVLLLPRPLRTGEVEPGVRLRIPPDGVYARDDAGVAQSTGSGVGGSLTSEVPLPQRPVAAFGARHDDTGCHFAGPVRGGAADGAGTPGHADAACHDPSASGFAGPCR